MRKSIYDNLWNNGPPGPYETYEKRQKRRMKYFNMIAPKGNWKMPIDTWIPQKHLVNCSKACVFFTGSLLTSKEFTLGGMCHVTADGYYQAVGA